MPDRHIFEVASDGAAHPTGATAPPEPSRAIARVREARAAGGRSAAAEPQRRCRRAQTPNRRAAPPAASARSVAGELESASSLALPPAESKPKRVRKTAEPSAAKAPAKRKKAPAVRKKATTTRKKKAATSTAKKK